MLTASDAVSSSLPPPVLPAAPRSTLGMLSRRDAIGGDSLEIGSTKSAGAARTLFAGNAKKAAPPAPQKRGILHSLWSGLKTLVRLPLGLITLAGACTLGPLALVQLLAGCFFHPLWVTGAITLLPVLLAGLATWKLK